MLSAGAAQAAKAYTASNRLQLFITGLDFPGYTLTQAKEKGTIPLQINLALYNYTDTTVTVEDLATTVFTRNQGGDWNPIGAGLPGHLQIAPGQTQQSIVLEVPIFQLGLTIFDIASSLLRNQALQNDFRVTVKGTALGIRLPLADEEFLFSEDANAPQGQVNGLGLVSKHHRKVKPGDEWAQYFDGLDEIGKEIRLPKGSQSDTQKDIVRIAHQCSWQ
ncbi:MAG TPA: hypothetical protein DCE41_04705, partial [Cytophagales bacterium]|nr:hypothetical protein [Cytophagales bacterium]